MFPHHSAGQILCDLVIFYQQYLFCNGTRARSVVENFMLETVSGGSGGGSYGMLHYLPYSCISNCLVIIINKVFHFSAVLLENEILCISLKISLIKKDREPFR